MDQVINWLLNCLDNVQEASFVVYCLVLEAKRNERSHNTDFYDKYILAQD